MHKRIKELDGVRGIAILMVLVWHYVSCQKPSIMSGSFLSYLYPFTTQFWSGVDLFFVLSGFLIGGIILDNHRKENFLKVFWIRRSCRILPVLLLLLCLCWILQSLLDKTRYAWLFAHLMPWWSYLTFLQNIVMGLRGRMGGHFLGVTWSLAVEEQFYLLAPIAILLIGRRLWSRALLPLICVAVVLKLIFPGFHAFVNTIFRMDALLAGVFISTLIRNEACWKQLNQLKGWFGMGLVGVLVLTGVLINSAGFNELELSSKTSWFALVYSLFLLVVLLYKDSSITYGLRSPVLCFWGQIAYGLYMYHQFILGLLHGWLRDGAPPSLEAPIAVAITAIAFYVSTGVAWLSFHTYEMFFLKIGRQQTYVSKSANQMSEGL